MNPTRHRCHVSWLISLMLLLPVMAYADASTQQGISYEFEAELDMYYSNMGWYFGLEEQPIPHVDNLKEWDVYKQLLMGSLTPDFIVLEMSVNPIPYLGTYMKRNNPNMSGFRESTFRSIVEGFDEPYALSLFAGRVFRFDGALDKNSSQNKGFIGYLVSVGDQHIKDSVLIRDNWIEVEWKAKGNRETEEQLLSWGLSVGAKFHSNPDIGDTLSLGFRRSSVDFLSGMDYPLLENIGFEYRYDMLQKNFKPSRHFLLLKKHIPVTEIKTAISFEIGFIWEGASRYTGVLSGNQGQEFTFILRPNITF